MPEKVIHEIRLDQYIACPADRTRRFSLGTRDSYGVEQLRIVPGEGWDGLTITATFHPPEGEAVQVLVPADGLIDVPPEATRSGSEATRSGSELPIKYGKIVFAGVADGVQRISCNLPYTVMEHAYTFGGTSTGPTPDVVSQILASTLEDRKAAATSSAQAEDAASIAAASARAAAESEAGSKSHADNAASSASAASAKAGDAAASAADAGASASRAANSASAAAASEQAAAKAAEIAQSATNEALAQAKASGEFDGADGAPGKDGVDGKSAYQYAVDGGYTGTEAEFAALMSSPGAYPVVDMTADTAELLPNIYYRWGEMSALTITLGAETAGITNEYCFEFVSGETATTLTVPDTVKWVQEPTIEADKTYQVSILNGIGVIDGV